MKCIYFCGKSTKDVFGFSFLDRQESYLWSLCSLWATPTVEWLSALKHAFDWFPDSVHRVQFSAGLAAEGELRHGLVGETLGGQHRERVTWWGSKSASELVDNTLMLYCTTHCRCSREGTPCAPAQGSQRGSNAARQAGRRRSWTGDDPEQPHCGGCAFCVLLCSFETTPMKMQRSQTSCSFNGL